MKKNNAVLVVMFLVTAILLTGCGENFGGINDTTSNTASTSTAPGDEKVTLVWWEGNFQEPEALEFKKIFEAEYPNIKIQLELLSYDGMETKQIVALKSGDTPDMITQIFGWTHSFALENLLLPLNDYIETAGIDLSDFSEVAMELGTIDGKIYGLPFRQEAMALLYNKEMFRDAGIDPEKPPVTREELIDYAKKLTIDKNGDGKPDQFGYGQVGSSSGNVIYRIMPEIWISGGSLVNDDFTKCMLDQPEAIEAVQYYTDLLIKHKVCPEGTIANDALEVRNNFINKTIAMYIGGNFEIDYIKDAVPDMDIGVALIPGKNPGESAAVLGGWNASIPAGSKNPDAAWTLLEFFVSEKVQEMYSMSFPARKSAMDGAKYQKIQSVDVFIKQMEYARNFPPVRSFPQIQGIILSELQAVMSGMKSAELAMKDATEQIDPLLK